MQIGSPRWKKNQHGISLHTQIFLVMCILDVHLWILCIPCEMITIIRLINKPITPYSYLCVFLSFFCFRGENSWQLFLVLLPAATMLRSSNLSICLLWLKVCSPWLLSLFPPSPLSPESTTLLSVRLNVSNSTHVWDPTVCDSMLIYWMSGSMLSQISMSTFFFFSLNVSNLCMCVHMKLQCWITQ